MTPLDLFAYVVAASLGLAVGVVVLAVVLGFGYAFFSTLLRRTSRGPAR